MAFRTQKRTGALLTGLLLLGPAAFAQEFRYQVWHGHWWPPQIRKAGNPGTLTVSASGIAFEETYRKGKTPKRPHAWQLNYQDIQQLKIAPGSLTVVTYQDNAWKLGADREYRFDLPSGKTFEDAYGFLKTRLDQRLVAAIPDTSSAALWELPVKHLLRFGGDEGTLRVGAGEIVYTSDKKNESRTWRFEDIENISSSGPFQLTITTYERAKTHYGSLKGFNFAPKQRLDQSRYDDLWRRLNQSKGLQILQPFKQQTKEQQP